MTNDRKEELMEEILKSLEELTRISMAHNEVLTELVEHEVSEIESNDREYIFEDDNGRTVVVCPECGDKFDSPSSIAAHISTLGDHKNILSYYRVDGKYQNPLDGREYPNKNSFRSSFNDFDESATTYLLRNYRDFV